MTKEEAKKNFQHLKLIDTIEKLQELRTTDNNKLETSILNSIIAIDLIDYNYLIGAHCIVCNGVKLGKGVTIGSNVYIGDYCNIDKHVEIGYNCKIGQSITIDDICYDYGYNTEDIGRNCEQIYFFINKSDIFVKSRHYSGFITDFEKYVSNIYHDVGLYLYDYRKVIMDAYKKHSESYPNSSVSRFDRIFVDIHGIKRPEIKSFFKGHRITWNGSSWYYDDTKTIINNSDSDKFRPCKKCGQEMNDHESDKCLGDLPGVSNACCGHGIREDSYICFTNGVVIRDFIVEYPQKQNTQNLSVSNLHNLAVNYMKKGFLTNDRNEALYYFKKSFENGKDAMLLYMEEKIKGFHFEDDITVPILCKLAATAAINAELYEEGFKIVNIGIKQKWIYKEMMHELIVLKHELETYIRLKSE